jgi:hypothetical protein
MFEEVAVMGNNPGVEWESANTGKRLTGSATAYLGTAVVILEQL